MSVGHSFLWPNNILFIRSSIDGHWGFFHIWAIVSNETVDVHIQVFVHTYVFIFLGYEPGSRMLSQRVIPVLTF